jgi:Tol biopolymer transport system component
MPALSVSPNGVLAYAPEAVGRQRRLVWFDRQGNRVGELPAQLPAGGVAGSAQQVRLSPDGTRLAYVRSADGGGPTAVWVADLQSGRTSRVTFGEGETAPLWTPDGESLCYVGRAGDGYEIRVRKLGGGERVLLSGRGRNRVVPLDWSPDGQFLAIADMNALKLLPLRHTGPGQPELIDVGVNSGFSFPQARFSPDGNYLAMVAAPGAESEIHVMPMPPGSGTWTLAKGTQPTWRSDGRELFYLEADMSLTSIDVTGAESFQTGSPRPLFTTAIDNLEVTKSNSYEVAPGGQRFLIRVPEQGAVAPLTVVMNWWAALKD